MTTALFLRWYETLKRVAQNTKKILSKRFALLQYEPMVRKSPDIGISATRLFRLDYLIGDEVFRISLFSPIDDVLREVQTSG